MREDCSKRSMRTDEQQYAYVSVCVFMIEVDYDYCLKIIRLKERLSDIIQPDYGLVHRLLSCGVISERDHECIRSGSSVYDRVDSLLHCLSSALTGDQYQALLAALEDTGQSHVANFICADGGL